LIVSRARRQELRRGMIGFWAGACLLPMMLVLGFAFDGHMTRLVQHFFVMGAA
jgi:hypothetical protein